MFWRFLLTSAVHKEVNKICASIVAEIGSFGTGSQVALSTQRFQVGVQGSRGGEVQRGRVHTDAKNESSQFSR